MTTRDEQQQKDSVHLDTSWQWLCQARKSAPANADIWDLRDRWPTYRETFLAQLQSGEYRLSPMQVVGRERQVMWSTEDTLALKWVVLQLVGEIPLHEKCEHLKGHGGGQASVQRVQAAINTKAYRWVCRTDIKGYYGAINTETLLRQLTAHITRPALLSLLSQFLHYSVEKGGNFHTPSRGIARSGALSLFMGALYLWVVDNYFSTQEKIYYARYRDNFLILTPTRWSLRRQVKQLNRYLNPFGFEKHPEKTFIGRIAKGFDWMGAWLTDAGVTDIAPRAKANHQEKLRRLYEQTQHWSKDRQRQRVSEYKKRWAKWFGNETNQTNTNHFLYSFSTHSSELYRQHVHLFCRHRLNNLFKSFCLLPAMLGVLCLVLMHPCYSSNNFTGTYAPGAGIIGSISPVYAYAENHTFSCSNIADPSVRGAWPGLSNSTWGVSSDGLFHGVSINGADSDVLLVYTGTISASNPLITAALLNLGIDSNTYQVDFGTNGAWSSNAPTVQSFSAKNVLMFYPVGLEQFLSSERVSSSGEGNYSIRLYIGPNARPGTYEINTLQGSFRCNGLILGTYVTASTVTILGRECSVSISPTNVSITGVRSQSGVRELIDNGVIQVRGNCFNGDSTTQGNMQFSITADNRTASPVGEADRALALLNDGSLPVASVTFHLPNNTDSLLLTGTKYNVPVTWENVNFDVSYNMYDLGAGETPAYGVGRGTAKFIVEWP